MFLLEYLVFHTYFSKSVTLISNSVNSFSILLIISAIGVSLLLFDGAEDDEEDAMAETRGSKEKCVCARMK
jgi:hypothetical protein